MHWFHIHYVDFLKWSLVNSTVEIILISKVYWSLLIIRVNLFRLMGYAAELVKC